MAFAFFALVFRFALGLRAGVRVSSLIARARKSSMPIGMRRAMACTGG